MMGTHPWETMSRGVVFVNKSLIMIIKYEMHFSELSKNVLGGEYQRYQILFGHDLILESLLVIVYTIALCMSWYFYIKNIYLVPALRKFPLKEGAYILFFRS